MDSFWKENEKDNDFSTYENRVRDIEKYEELLYSKDAEIASLKNSLREMSEQMKDNMYADSADYTEFNVLKEKVDKYKTLLKETEEGEKDLFNALKETKLVIRERDIEIKKLKDHIKTQDEKAASDLKEMKHQLNSKSEGCVQLNNDIKSLQTSLKEKEQNIEEIRLSLWETQNHLERETKRLKKANEDNVIKKERELSELKRTFEAEKRRFEDEMKKMRESSSAKVDELNHLKKVASNFQDTITIDEATINQLKNQLYEKDCVVYDMEQTARNEKEQYENIKNELEKKILLLGKDLETADEKCKVFHLENEHSLKELHHEVKDLLLESSFAKKKLQENMASRGTDFGSKSVLHFIQIYKAEAEQELQSLQERFDKSREELVSHKDVKAQLEMVLKEAMEKDVKIAVLQKNMSEIEHLNKIMKNNIANITSKLDSKTQSLFESTKTIETLETEKKNNNEEIISLKRQLEEELAKKKDNKDLTDKLKLHESLLREKENEFILIREKLKAAEMILRSDEQKSQKERLCKLEYEINSLHILLREKETLVVSLQNLLKEAKSNEEHLEIENEKLAFALNEEKNSHSKCQNDAKELIEKYTILLAEMKKYEETHKVRMKEVNEYYLDFIEEKKREKENLEKLLSDVKNTKNEEIVRLKRQLEDLESAKKSENNSKNLEIENLKASLSKAAKSHDVKMEDLNKTFDEEKAKKDEAMSELSKEISHLKEQLEKKKHEMALENEAHELIYTKYKEDLDKVKEIQAEALRRASSEREELKETTKNLKQEKDADIQKIIDSSNQALAKKDETLLGLKTFVQETTAKTKKALMEKDEVIKRLKQHIDSLNKELFAKEQSLHSQEEELNKLKSDHQYEFSVLVKKCTDFQEQLSKSEESRTKLEEHSKNFLKDFQVKTKQRENILKNAQIELKTAQISNKDLQQELESVKLSLQKKELMLKEAGKIIQNITVEKNKKTSELKESNELCDKMQNLLIDKESLAASLTKHKASLTSQNKELQKQNAKLQEKTNKREKKIQEFEKEMKRLRTIVMDLEQKNSKAGQLNVVIKEKLAWMNKANSDHKQSMENTIHEKNELVKQLSNLQSEKYDADKQIENTKNILAEKNSLISELERRHSEIESQKEKLDHNLLEMKSKLKKNEKEVVALKDTVNSLQGKEKTLLQENSDLERAKNEELDSLKREFEALRFYLGQSEEIIVNLTKERDAWMQEYEKAIQIHKDVTQTMGSYNNSITNDKQTLEEKLNQMEKAVTERNCEIGELKNILSSAETAQQYLNEKIQEQNSIKIDLEKKNEENNSLKDQIRAMERTLEKETHDGRKRIKKSEEYFARLRDEKEKLESSLRDKDQELQESQKINNNLIIENEELNTLANKTNVVNKELEMALLSYKGEAEQHVSTLAQLKADNQFLQEYAKGTEKTKLKLESIQESLQKKTIDLAELNEKLLIETTRCSTLQAELDKRGAACHEIKENCESRVKTSKREIEELRALLDERNKDLSTAKIERNNCELKQREAELKVLELTNTVRDNTIHEQTMAQRNKELEEELRSIQYEKRRVLLASSLDTQHIIRDKQPADVMAERCLKQKLDNIAVDKLRNLHTKASQLEVQLEQERHDRVKEHAEVARLKAELAVYKSIQ